MKIPRWVGGFSGIKWPAPKPFYFTKEKKSAFNALMLNGFEVTNASLAAVISLHRSLRRQEQLAFCEVLPPDSDQPCAFSWSRECKKRGHTRRAKKEDGA
jgi:hypothetical protein